MSEELTPSGESNSSAKNTIWVIANLLIKICQKSSSFQRIVNSPNSILGT